MKRPSKDTKGQLLSWYFEPIGAMGGASSSAYQNSLAGAGVPPAQLFAREAIQNSVDAAHPDKQTVAVRFRSEKVSEERLEDFRRALRLKADDEPLRRQGLFPGGKGRDLSTLLKGPVRVLYVEDFNTVGLGGTTEPIAPTEEDNYFRLCLMLGDTRTTETGGGTFGYGKSVYWAMSSLWTVVSYSRFEATERTSGTSARLIAVSWFNPHIHPGDSGREVRYTGRAWFGVKHEDGCQPLVDDEAHELAERLGFRRRGPEDYGLSILILGTGVATDELREGVERHWWPRLLDGKLEVSFAQEGEDLAPPRPGSNTNLNRFVRAWDLVKGNVEPAPRDAVAELAYKRTVLGKFAITTGSEHEDEEFGDPQGPPRHVEIALVRKPGMVVEYFAGPALSPSQPTCGAVFLADPAMNAVFAVSEPPAHNKWDFRTTRRDRPLTEDQRRQIETTLEKIKKTARTFVLSKQAPPPTAPPRCRELEKLLGKWIPIGGPEPPPPPPPTSDPFQIRFVDEVHRVDAEDGVALDASVEVGLRGEAELEPENLVRIRAWVDTVVDDGNPASREERLRMAHIIAKESNGVITVGEYDESGSFVDVVLSPGGPPHVVDVRSEVLPHLEYRASLSISVEVLP